MKYLLLISVFILYSTVSVAQSVFKTVSGSKASYTIAIPDGFKSQKSIGANVDLKYLDSTGASIVTVVRKLPAGVTDGQLNEMSYPSDAAVKDQLESAGMENVNIIKRGMTSINEVSSYYQYYTAVVNGITLYYHSINQFYKGKMFVLTFTCEYSEKFSYLPYINRVVNSFTHK